MMKKNFIERRVLVCFKQNISEDLIAQYFDGIEELRKATPDIIKFELYNFERVDCEAALNNTVSNAIYPDVMTLWRFNDNTALEAFISSETHHRIAQQKFKPAVERRIVFNSRGS
jgi:Stress responsive A/B Barrel Domain